jgi:hypothetical protein
VIHLGTTAGPEHCCCCCLSSSCRARPAPVRPIAAAAAATPGRLSLRRCGGVNRGAGLLASPMLAPPSWPQAAISSSPLLMRRVHTLPPAWTIFWKRFAWRVHKKDK